jgi:hypothetical protein
MTKINSHSEFRDGLEEYLRAQMIGPSAGDNEKFSIDGAAPSYEYSTGILYPQSLMSSRQAAETACSDDAQVKRSFEEDSFSDSRTSANNYNQSSCGITFTIDSSEEEIHFKATAGHYVPSELKEGQNPNKREWTRHNIVIEKRLKRSEMVFGELRNLGKSQLKSSNDENDIMILKVLVRQPSEDGSIVITASLVNNNKKGDTKEYIQLTEKSYFQVQLEVNCVKGFVARKFKAVDGMDYDKLSAYLLYSHVPEFAIGHGCAAKWASGNNRPKTISTNFIPSFDVLPMVDGATRHSSMPKLNVRLLANPRLLADNLMLAEFDKLCAGYEAWIKKLTEEKLQNIPAQFRSTAERQHDECKIVLHRMREGVKTLQDNPLAMKAFRHANESMYEVMVKSKSLKDNPEKIFSNNDSDKPDCFWRPFQMAFVLISLTSLVDENHQDREICDLLWFPTGGGKTEAYLLLSSFELFLRRLRCQSETNKGGGVAIIMRYTLRLLTVDQFLRVARMIVSCEKIRRKYRDDYTNSESISLGLWLGGKSTPNKFSEACEVLDQLKATGENPNPEVGSPCKLVSCPCCNSIINYSDYKKNEDTKNIEIVCPNLDCIMHSDEERVGIYVVDESIYRVRPSFLIGTIDKFALLSYKLDSSNLFSTDNRYRQPDLIIQDELHLITGPLGTVAAIYEAAIDRLCSMNGIRPKIIASTATIRNAEKQVKALFARKYSQFPQPFLDARDSYFAVESQDSNASRKYVGVYTSGRSVQWSIIRTSASLLQGVKELEAPDDISDPYYTLVGYFSTIRELAGSHVKFNEDIKEVVNFFGSEQNRLPGNGPRLFSEPKELASRVPEIELNATRDLLSNSHLNQNHVDVVLCSNMISVGLDISRLSLMFVQGQPKTTAEYIQATSRVGRTNPGLVVTCYNPTRARDRSIYEHFTRYHGSFYAEVEATSVTPAASRARDRALHAAFVILMRYLPNGLPNDGDASKFKSTLPLVDEVKNYLVERISLTDPVEKDSVRVQVEKIIQKWQTMADVVQPRLTFGANPYSPRKLLTSSFEISPSDGDESFKTAYQMRSVEGQARAFITR